MNAAATFKANDSFTHIADGGSFYLRNAIYLYEEASSNNVLRVENGGVWKSGVIYFNRTTACHDNRIEVLNGVFSPGQLLFSGYNSGLVVSNSVFETGGNNYLTGHDNYMRFIGDGNTWTRSASGLFQYGREFTNNVLTIDGGRLSWPGGSLYLGVTGSVSNRVEVINGGVLSCSNSFRMQPYSSPFESVVGNRVYVGSGSVLESPTFIYTYAGNSLVISNATVRNTGSNSISLMLGDTKEGYEVRDNTIVFEGASPRFIGTEGGTFYSRNRSRIVFNLPPTGFTGDGAVITCGKFNDDGTTTLEINGLSELSENLAETAVYVLAEATAATASVAFTAAEIAALNATLPDNCRVYTEGARLLLRVRVRRGFSLLLR